MTIHIVDLNGADQDMDWLLETYGNIRFHDAGAGQRFKLMRIDETEGPSLLKVRVLDANGVPMSNQPVANSWPDDDLPDLREGNLKSLWRDRAIHQRTDGAGFTGFGLGTGSYIRDFEKGGPHTIWILSPTHPSDGISGLGMLGGTEHRGPLFLTFQLVDGDTTDNGGGDDPDDGGEPLPSGEIMEKLDAIHNDLQRLMEHLGL